MAYDYKKYSQPSKGVRKYRLTSSLLSTSGGVNKLIRDGFTREDISKALYAEGATNPAERRAIIDKLHTGGED